MKILDRYIVSRYVFHLFASLMAAVIIFLVINNVDNLDTFLDNNVPVKTIFRYYYLFIPHIIYLTLPVATLLATLFTIGGMTQSNEMTAMYASGIPFSRALILLLFVAGACSVGVLFLGETIVPVANRERYDIERYDVKKIPRETRANLGRLYFHLEGGKQLFVERFNAISGEANGIQIITADSGRVLERIEAEKMVWRDGKWHLGGVVISRFEADGWMRMRRDDEMDFDKKGIEPDAFAKIQTAPEEMNYYELEQFIERMKLSGGDPRKWEVDLKIKLASPLAAIIIVLFGAPVAAVRRRGGTALAFALALLICFVYFGFTQVGRVMGHNGILSPMVAAWIGNLFFGTLGLIMSIGFRR